MNCRWGQKAFHNYLGDENIHLWQTFDALKLVENMDNDAIASLNAKPGIMIDQGTDDDFLKHGNDNHNQLRTKEFEIVCKQKVMLFFLCFRIQFPDICKIELEY